MITLIKKFGSDREIAQIARISHGSVSSEKGDKRLIKGLMLWEHFSPFEHAGMTFKIEAPIFVARQWFRHRIGSFMEKSGRYTEMNDGFFVPDNMRAKGFAKEMRENMEKTFRLYYKLVEKNVDKEVARMILPISTYTEFYWTVNLRSLIHFLELRTAKEAQKEMRDYANMVEGFFAKEFPTTFEAWKDVRGI